MPTPRLLGIDGRSGSGKSWLAQQICHSLDSLGLTRTVVAMDDLYPGWHGLAQALPTLCTDVIDPLRDGAEAVYRRYDWAVGAFTEQVRVPPTDIVVIEGVGATWHRRRQAFAVTVWVQAPSAVRHQRACARSGQGDFAAHAQSWSDAENALFGPDGYPRPPARFDRVVDTARHEEDRHG
ncbi:MAG: hypothetical protein WA892_14820 [Ornithinimicrobium sp.]